jgi:hypothetical protein
MRIIGVVNQRRFIAYSLTGMEGWNVQLVHFINRFITSIGNQFALCVITITDTMGREASRMTINLKEF